MRDDNNQYNLILKILCIDHAVFEGEVHMVILPGRYGELGVMARHENFIAELKVGAVYIHHLDSTISKFYISDGHLHVQSNICTLCVDDAVAVDGFEQGVITKELDNIDSLFKSRCALTDSEVEFLNNRKTFYSVAVDKCGAVVK